MSRKKSRRITPHGMGEFAVEWLEIAIDDGAVGNCVWDASLGGMSVGYVFRHPFSYHEARQWRAYRTIDLTGPMDMSPFVERGYSRTFLPTPGPMYVQYAGARVLGARRSKGSFADLYEAKTALIRSAHWFWLRGALPEAVPARKITAEDVQVALKYDPPAPRKEIRMPMKDGSVHVIRTDGTSYWKEADANGGDFSTDDLIRRGRERDTSHAVGGGIFGDPRPSDPDK